ncbi:MAG: aminoacyl-tRNA hydrolase [Zoogloeaceae bacterium]|nr:aminoacyl-tRNA hydrolase [Zoogloeaceae bacterium]
MAAPRLIVGLGNPGSKHADNRHNAGFWLCERLAAMLGAELRPESRFHGIAGHARDRTRNRTHDQARDPVWLLMPQTYMNRSGQSVAALARFYRIPPTEMLVLHDELDLPPGALRLKFGGGLGGHNGLKDIAAHLGTQDFWRLRIGVGHPGDRDLVVDYVLKKPRAEERALIEDALDRALEHWPLIKGGDYSAAMQKLNAKANP